MTIEQTITHVTQPEFVTEPSIPLTTKPICCYMDGKLIATICSDTPYLQKQHDQSDRKNAPKSLLIFKRDAQLLSGRLLMNLEETISSNSSMVSEEAKEMARETFLKKCSISVNSGRGMKIN
ncbi:hypothetical protein [Endozoicomonas ascidiicola]|uniref:hypothetical protein n=1 Tax=Endozoicomonas ascidiicola TaxID=1698521 RepID=UPI000834A7AE|nr:hypothetical protein [Endozoicomonas ascidiicola]